MDLLNKLIEDFFLENIGKDVLELYHLIRGKEPVSEFKLAEKLNLTVNQVRNMLYRLYSYSLVDFIRKKDKKKGWYIYYWAFNTKRGLETALAHKEERLKLLKNLLNKEQTTQYFVCKECEIRLGFDQAIENDYKCPECDKVLVQDNNQKKIQILSKKISELEEEIKKGREIKIEYGPLMEFAAKKKGVKKKKAIKKIKKKKAKKKKPARKKPKKPIKKKKVKKKISRKKKTPSRKIRKKIKAKKSSKKISKKKSVSKRRR